MAGEKVKVRYTAVTGMADVLSAGWNAGKKGEKTPDWVDATLMSFVGQDRNSKAIVKLANGKVKEVRLSDIEFE